MEDPPATQVLWKNTEAEIFVGVNVGYPAPEYLWKKDGVKFDANSGRYSLQRDGSIRISSVAAEDDGDYTVRISQLNRRRETTEKIKVIVVGNYQVFFFMIRLYNVRYLTLQLQVAKENSSMAKLKQINVLFTSTDPPQIDTTEPAIRNLTFGYPARLACSVSGIPKPEITWTGPDNKPITESNFRISLERDGSVTLSQAELADLGTWTCKAKNSVGTASRQIEIQAIYSKFSFVKRFFN